MTGYNSKDKKVTNDPWKTIYKRDSSLTHGLPIGKNPWKWTEDITQKVGVTISGEGRLGRFGSRSKAAFEISHEVDSDLAACWGRKFKDSKGQKCHVYVKFSVLVGDEGGFGGIEVNAPPYKGTIDHSRVKVKHRSTSPSAMWNRGQDEAYIGRPVHLVEANVTTITGGVFSNAGSRTPEGGFPRSFMLMIEVVVDDEACERRWFKRVRFDEK